MKSDFYARLGGRMRAARVEAGLTQADVARGLGEAVTLHDEIRAVLNRHSAENNSGTPDFILADYLLNCLNAYDLAVRSREQWHGREPDENECSGPAVEAKP